MTPRFYHKRVTVEKPTAAFICVSHSHSQFDWGTSLLTEKGETGIYFDLVIKNSVSAMDIVVRASHNRARP